MLNTPWGYEIVKDEPIVSVSEFNVLTQNKFNNRRNEEIRLNLSAVSEQIRNYCGWHIAPIINCKATISAEGAQEIKLPALVVCDVESVKDDGVEILSSCQYSQRGRLRRNGCNKFSDKLDGTVVIYSAGLKSTLLERIVVQAASNLLVSPIGIREEHAGGIGVSYVNNGEGIISDRALSALSAFKLQCVK